MNFTNRQKPSIYQMIDVNDSGEQISELKKVELRRITQDGESGTPLSAEVFNQFNDEKVSKTGIDTERIDISCQAQTHYYMGREVKGLISGTAEVILTHCDGNITISGRDAKIYLNNCPKLIVNGITRENWGNVYKNGVAKYNLIEHVALDELKQQGLLPQAETELVLDSSSEKRINCVSNADEIAMEIYIESYGFRTHLIVPTGDGGYSYDYFLSPSQIVHIYYLSSGLQFKTYGLDNKKVVIRNITVKKYI